MAVAAYASVVSLLNVIDEFQRHPFPHPVRLHPIMKQFETLEERVHFLIDFLENHSSTKLKEIEDLARHITHFANEAEDAIDIHVEDLIRSKDMSLLNSFNQAMEKAIEEVDSLMADVLRVPKVEKATELPAVPPTASQRPNPSHGKSMMVGFDERLGSVKRMLAEGKPNLQVIPIVGMGGIGKTTLAINTFEDKFIVEHFHLRKFCTISQEYSVKDILRTLLGFRENKECNKDESDLGLELYQSLCGKRYLIVLDDVWSSKAWDELRLFFPNDGNGSRIMLTTRLFDVADSFGSRNSYSMDFLDDGKSWDLFRKVAFAQVACCPELEEIGRSIAKSCRGLPLAIVVIAGLLANSKMTREYWELVAENVNSFVYSESDEHCLKVLSLSYHNLPIHLKPCFLYLSVFPEDDVIDIPELIREWVARGYIKPIKSKSLEEVAEEYLKELSRRNLISIHKKSHFAIRMERCSIHDSLRELCLRESHKEQLFRIPQIISAEDDNGDIECFECFVCDKYDIDHFQRVSVYDVHLGSLSTSLVRPLVCIACTNMYPQLHGSRFVHTQIATDFCRELLLPTKLRHLACYNFNAWEMKLRLCPLLWKLQTLIIDTDAAKIYAPSEIWKMPQLRHLMIKPCVILDDPKVTSGITRKAENLQTLRCVKDPRWTEDDVKMIPNVKELGLICSRRELSPTFYSLSSTSYSLCYLAHLHRLESLWLNSRCHDLEKDIAFPMSLKKLTLVNIESAWEHMEIVGSLPNLQVLKLKYTKLGQEWTPIEGQFQQLKSLILINVDLLWWTAEKMHFPVLESLVLRSMPYLEEIPQGVGEIDSLRYIEVLRCRMKVGKSAEAILEQQESYGNDDLRLDTLGNRRMRVKNRRLNKWE